jgi:3-methyladenine DNA glycosylase AlkD
MKVEIEPARPTLQGLQQQLKELSNPKDARQAQRFFKTGPGQYGEGDRFRGIRMPELRKLTRKFRSLDLRDIDQLLRSKYHEDRMVALLILVLKYQSGDNQQQETICRLYVRRIRYVNSWDLVDLTAEHIIGAWLADKNKEPLYQLARSQDLWERRVAILSTLHYIKQNQFSETLKIAAILLNDEHDLIHKAVGWMLREVGKRNMTVEETFLKKHYKRMARTMLRYAIERFPERKRRAYLLGKV